MSVILAASVSIQGTRPLLLNAFKLEVLTEMRPEKTGRPGNDPEEWKRSVLATPEGQLYIEPSYIFGSFRDGAKYVPKGRSTMETLVAATLQVTDERVLITNRALPFGLADLPRDETALVYLDVRSVKNPGTRNRNIRYRVAAASGWLMSFQIVWDATVVNRDVMKAVAREAGYLSGIGDGRKIGFGRYEIVEFEVRNYQYN